MPLEASKRVKLVLNPGNPELVIWVISTVVEEFVQESTKRRDSKHLLDREDVDLAISVKKKRSS